MAGDVVDLILADHRQFESLLRELRKEESDRTRLRTELADLLVAHAEAEEHEVYPRLRRKDAIDADTAEHGEHEHAEGHEALLKVLEVQDVESTAFGDALEELTKELAHHMDEEERTVLNPARLDIPDETRQKLGLAFMTERQSLLDVHCGAIENVRRLVAAAKADDLI
jgi:hypothetical protein